MQPIKAVRVDVILTPHDTTQVHLAPPFQYNAAIDAFCYAPMPRHMSAAPNIPMYTQDTCFERFCGWVGGLFDRREA